MAYLKDRNESTQSQGLASMQYTGRDTGEHVITTLVLFRAQDGLISIRVWTGV